MSAVAVRRSARQPVPKRSIEEDPVVQQAPPKKKAKVEKAAEPVAEPKKKAVAAKKKAAAAPAPKKKAVVKKKEKAAPAPAPAPVPAVADDAPKKKKPVAKKGVKAADKAAEKAAAEAPAAAPAAAPVKGGKKRKRDAVEAPAPAPAPVPVPAPAPAPAPAAAEPAPKKAKKEKKKAKEAGVPLPAALVPQPPLPETYKSKLNKKKAKKAAAAQPLDAAAATEAVLNEYEQDKKVKSSGKRKPAGGFPWDNVVAADTPGRTLETFSWSDVSKFPGYKSFRTGDPMISLNARKMTILAGYDVVEVKEWQNYSRRSRIPPKLVGLFVPQQFYDLAQAKKAHAQEKQGQALEVRVVNQFPSLSMDQAVEIVTWAIVENNLAAHLKKAKLDDKAKYAAIEYAKHTSPGNYKNIVAEWLLPRHAVMDDAGRAELVDQVTAIERTGAALRPAPVYHHHNYNRYEDYGWGGYRRGWW